MVGTAFSDRLSAVSEGGGIDADVDVGGVGWEGEGEREKGEARHAHEGIAGNATEAIWWERLSAIGCQRSARAEGW